MKRYFYRALKEQKDLVSGYIEADNYPDARVKVRKLGLMPTYIYEENPQREKITSKKGNSQIKISARDRILFTSEMQTLLSSSISLLEALETIAKYSPKKNLVTIAVNIGDKIKKGTSFTEALELYPETFDQLYISLCKAGEYAGNLPKVLEYLLTYLKKQETLKWKYLEMSIYPCIVIFGIIGIYFFMGGFVFPRMIQYFYIDTPPVTASIFIESVQFILNYWWAILLIFCGGLCCIKFAGLKKIKSAFTHFVMKIPPVSNCIKYFSLTHFMTVIQIAYESGIPMIETFSMAVKTISNEIIHKQAVQASELLKKGLSLTESFEKSGLIPPILLPVVAAGEKSGKLGDVFRDTTIAIEKKLDTAIQILAKLFEPVVLVIIGGAVLYTVLVFFQLYLTAVQSIL